MITTMITSVIAYVSTNIDDILIVMVLFMQANANFRSIFLGKFLGIAFLTAVSLLCAFGLGFFPQQYIRFLGIVPIFLGIKVFFEYHKKNNTVTKEDHCSGGSVVLNTALITIANGADNVGVYIPLFVGYSLLQMLVTILIFSFMTVLWCILGSKMVSLPFVMQMMERYRHIAVPVIYILLGVYIFVFS